MNKYTMQSASLQEVKVPNPADPLAPQTRIYLDAAGNSVEPLEDARFSWRAKKKKTLALADIYQEAREPRLSERALTCSTWLEYLANADCSTRQLHHFNACKMRICPLCAARKAKIMAKRLTKIIERVQADHPDSQLLFLTLTVENCTGDKLRETLDLLTKAWKKLIDRRPVKRAIKGWFRALEVTRNRKQDTYHPHIHAILVVENDYFAKKSGLYLTHDTWVAMWQQCLQVSYRPIVGVQKTYGKGGQGTRKAAAATVEAAKYATKDRDFIDPALPRAEAARVAMVYTNALRKKRMTAMGGWVSDAADALALDVEDVQDLVSDGDDGELTVKTAELLESYGWHFGVGEHVLTERRLNPDFEGSEDGSGDAGE